MVIRSKWSVIQLRRRNRGPTPLSPLISVAYCVRMAHRFDRQSRLPASSQRWGHPYRSVATIIALVLMVPIGFVYLVTGLIAPSPDVFGAYVLFALLLGGAVWLARRRSWWVVAIPIVSIGIWPLMAWAGETYLDWSP